MKDKLFSRLILAALPLISWVCISQSCLAAGKVTFNLAGEPKTLDPHLATGELEGYVINQLMEGLTLSDAKGQPVPGIAEKWDISDNGTSYTFYLRQAQWSNGTPVTAADFVYGWQRCLKPAMGAEYAYQLYPVKGAEEFNKGSETDFSKVGVTAESDRVLTVQLKEATPYFLSVLNLYAYFPANEAWDKAHPDWAQSPANYLSNGPFTLADWRHRDRVITKKNSKYYGAADVQLDEIEMPIISNESTALLQWETGKIDIVVEIALPDVPRLTASGQLKSSPYLGTYYIALNGAIKPLNDKRVRKALALATDRNQVTKAILRGGQSPARGIVPEGIEIEGQGDYRKITGDEFTENIAEAKKLMAEAGYPNGRGFPPLKFLYNDMEMHRTIAEALQRMWQQNLGIRVTLQVQEYKVYLQNLHSKNYQMARAGWIADFADPMTYLDMYETGAGNNSFNYSNKEYDAMVRQIRKTTGTQERLKLMQNAEKLLIGEDMAVVPLYFYTKQYVTSPRVEGFHITPGGGINFRKISVRNP